MSKYTTEVRFICEQKAGLDHSTGYNDVDEVLENSYRKIFDVDNIPVYVAEHKPLLLKKILLHYYSREIGCETVGLWQMRLNQKLKEIMPYYNQLYKSELIEYDPLKNVDDTHTHVGSYSDNSVTSHTKVYENVTTHDNDIDETYGKEINENKEGTSVYSSEERTDLKHAKTTHHDSADEITREMLQNKDTWSLFSDTPQGGIEGLTNAPVGSGQQGDTNNYLTNATHIIDNDGKTKDTHTFGDVTEVYNYGNVGGVDKVNTEGESTDTLTGNTTEDGTKHIDDVGTKEDNATTQDDGTKNDTGRDNYTNNETGKIGVLTYQEMILKYRETFLNIDMMIINELKDLFMKVW